MNNDDERDYQEEAANAREQREADASEAEGEVAEGIDTIVMIVLEIPPPRPAAGTRCQAPWCQHAADRYAIHAISGLVAVCACCLDRL